MPDGSRESLENEIADSEARLQSAKLRLVVQTEQDRRSSKSAAPNLEHQQQHHHLTPDPSRPLSAYHHLLLLSDSALPLGSFAFSSGLESYKAHVHSSAGAAAAGTGSFLAFLPLSLSAYASTTLPFVLAAHRDPNAVAELDDLLDAATICTVGRRASVVQGRALLSVWDKSFAVGVAEQQARALIASLRSLPGSSSSNNSNSGASSSSSSSSSLPQYSAHLAPLFGAVCNLLGLTLHQTAYVFMLSHVKALVSAGVRAAMMGPYVAQRILAAADTQAMIADAVEREWSTPVEEAGQRVPVMDLWIGRHEMLYSRIFNS